MSLCLSLLFFPDFVLGLVTDDQNILPYAKKIMWVLYVVLGLFSISVIYFNGLVGTGATKVALYIQVSCVLLYMIYVYVVIGIMKCSLEIAWMADGVYLVSSLIISIIYLKSNRWLKVKI
jgi:Na+-driven multidrug efflux pump